MGDKFDDDFDGEGFNIVFVDDNKLNPSPSKLSSKLSPIIILNIYNTNTIF